MRGASLFSGGGIADIGFMNAGIDMIWGLDYHKDYGDKIAKWNQQETGTEIFGIDILTVEPADLPRVDFLHLSPPCPSFSNANQSNEGETENDIQLAKKCAEIIRELRPRILTLENVWLYRHSQSYRILVEVFNELYPFRWDVNNLSAADFGVPQSRSRMIVRAISGPAFLPALPKPEPWVGWYEAIEDLIPGLKASALVPWQIERLKGSKFEFLLDPEDQATGGEYLVGQGQSGYYIEGVSYDRIPTVKESESPAPTVASGSGGRGAKIVLVRGDNASHKQIARPEEDPAFTVTTTDRTLHRAILVRGDYKSTKMTRERDQPAMTIRASRSSIPRMFTGSEIKALDTRCSARFQSIPDWYNLPKSNAFAQTIIGNGYPSLMAEKITRQLIKTIGG